MLSLVLRSLIDRGSSGSKRGRESFQAPINIECVRRAIGARRACVAYERWAQKRDYWIAPCAMTICSKCGSRHAQALMMKAIGEVGCSVFS
jgi:hypothetical protein